MKKFVLVVFLCAMALLSSQESLAAMVTASPATSSCTTTTVAAKLNDLTPEEKVILETFSESFLQFSPQRCHFTNNQGVSLDGTLHDGYDFNCYPPGQPFDLWIYIPLKIQETAFDPVYGNYIIATDLEEKLTFVFGHADKVYVKTGEITQPYKPLMKVGTTGNSSGVHLHLEILKGGFPIQLGDCVFEYFKTIYRKVEKDPIEVIAQTMQLPRAQVQKYILLLSSKKYPLNVYKLFSLSLYEDIPFPFVSWLAQQNSKNFYNFAAYFSKQNRLATLPLRKKAEANAKLVMAEFCKKQFVMDYQKEKEIELAEKKFKANYFNGGFAASIKPKD